MDIRAIQTALAAAVSPFVPCHDQIPANTDFPCAYIGLPESITLGATMGSHLIDMAVTLCFSRNDDQLAQAQLSELLSSGLLDALNTVANPPWYAAEFTNVTRFRVAKFAGGDTEVIACDLNLTARA